MVSALLKQPPLPIYRMKDLAFILLIRKRLGVATHVCKGTS
ncbi:hypothetical protein ADUPG1_014343, partial [Aduncisulcus paluster]